MTMLLRELDRGPAALPRGSELTLFNSQTGLLGSIRDRAKLESLSVLHVEGNPLDVEDLRIKLDISRCVTLCNRLSPSKTIINLAIKTHQCLRRPAYISLVALPINGQKYTECRLFSHNCKSKVLQESYICFNNPVHWYAIRDVVK